MPRCSLACWPGSAKAPTAGRCAGQAGRGRTGPGGARGLGPADRAARSRRPTAPHRPRRKNRRRHPLRARRSRPTRPNRRRLLPLPPPPRRHRTPRRPGRACRRALLRRPSAGHAGAGDQPGWHRQRDERHRQRPQRDTGRRRCHVPQHASRSIRLRRCVTPNRERCAADPRLPGGAGQRRRCVESSGYRSLDRAARDAVTAWHFLPAVKDGEPIRSTWRCV